MNFIDVQPHNEDHLQVLYSLLGERKLWQNISHEEMPSWTSHCSYVQSKPYREWFILFEDESPLGAINLTKKNEIGIQLFRKCQKKGIGTFALRWMIVRHSGERLIANVNPNNMLSLGLFTKLGFVMTQLVFVLDQTRKVESSPGGEEILTSSGPEI